jgi:hypothetical protein
MESAFSSKSFISDETSDKGSSLIRRLKKVFFTTSGPVSSEIHYYPAQDR